MESVIKRVDKHLKYFARQVTTDKWLAALIIAVFASIIIVFVISFYAKKDYSQWNDIIQ